MPSPEFRPIFIQIVDRFERPLIGVHIDVYADEKKIFNVLKQTSKPIRVEISPPDVDATIVAHYGEEQSERRVVGAAARECKIRFSGVSSPVILIVCALPLEAAALLATCDKFADIPLEGLHGDPNIYRIGTYLPARPELAARNVLIAISGMGTLSASVVTTHALRSFWEQLRHVLMVGIAGGCPNPTKADEHVRLGDIVVANGVVQYDYVKREVDEVKYRGHPQRPSAEMSQAADQLNMLALLGQRPWEPWIALGQRQMPNVARPAEAEDVLHAADEIVVHPADAKRRPGWPIVHRGAIGTANILLKDPKLRDEVRNRWGVRAIEMEGSGVLDAGWAMNKDVMIVRGICDYCDQHKNDKWQPYAALVAAAYARSLVETLPEGLLVPKMG